MSYDMEDFYGEVALFNALKGWTADKEYSYETVNKMLKGQLDRVKEELDEAYEALETHDESETLKESVDILVTAMGLVQILEMLGTDVMHACFDVSRNNLSKYTEVEEEALSTVEYYKGKGEDCSVFVVGADDEGSIYGVRRNSDGKLMKPKDHPRLEMSSYLPRPVDSNVH